jgi:pyruvate formate lyase activating enzyme
LQYGIVSDIRDFTLHDGPGIRMTVFLKGCPLRCQWCHNPEMISPEPQSMRSPAGDRTVGRRYSSDELASIVLAEADVLRANHGGVTFSGGEPLMQSLFLEEVIERIRPLHVVLDTSGYARPEVFRKVVAFANLIHFDLKLMDPEEHRRFTGTDNRFILGNLDWLATSGVPFVARVPLVPGVTDTPRNLERIAQTVCGNSGLQCVEFLPYNRAAGGKYAGLGMEFHPDYDETRPLNMDFGAFAMKGCRFRVVGQPARG